MSRLLTCLLAITWVAAGRLARAEDVPHVPLRAGLTIVTAISGGDGDYESIKRVESEDAKGLRIRYSSESLHDDAIDVQEDQYQHFRPSPTSASMLIRTLTVYRTVLRPDLKSADH